jgi:hypothetical protein
MKRRGGVDPSSSQGVALVPKNRPLLGPRSLLAGDDPGFWSRQSPERLGAHQGRPNARPPDALEGRNPSAATRVKCQFDLASRARPERRRRHC